MRSSAWLLTRASDPRARVRLLGVPNAGAGALTFRDWPKALPGVDLALAHLPGRDGRRHEPLPTSITDVAAAIARALLDLAPLPTAIFGHSMGALVGFEVARALQAAGRGPAGLVVSGRRAPSRPATATDVSALASDDEFLGALHERYGGVPDVIWSDEDLRAMWVPTVRADMAMVHRYRREPGRVLTCPIWSYGGRDDRQTSEAELADWKNETTGPFTLRWFTGGHFFIESAKPDVLDALATDLASLRLSP